MSYRMNRRVFVAAAVVVFLVTSGVVLWISHRPVSHNTGQTECGTASSTQPWVVNCLTNAYFQQRVAKGTIVSSTLEGDVIIYTVTVASPTSLQVVVDNRDRYGQPGVYGYSCSGMIRIDQYRVSLNGCSGNGPLGPGATLNVPS